MSSASDPTAEGAAGLRRRGRRPSGQDTREALLHAARELFGEQSYDRVTVRSIATKAGVDPAMVNHWFGGKDALFAAAVSLPFDPAVVIPQLLDGDPAQLGHRIVRTFLSVWDEAGGGGFVALVRSVATHDDAVIMLQDFVRTMLFGRLTRELDVDHAEFRAALCGSQIVGLGMMRYVVRLEPLASADHETIVATIAPTLQHYLSAALDADEQLAANQLSAASNVSSSKQE